jgi:hypothetical protein
MENGIDNEGSERYNKNIIKHNESNKKFNDRFSYIYLHYKINYNNIFKKIKYHFVNQHKFINFENFPKHEKIIYIGGINVEDKKILMKKKIKVNENEVKFNFR